VQPAIARRTTLVAVLLAALLTGLVAVAPSQAAPGDESLTLTRVADASAPVTLTSPPGDERRFVAQLGGTILLLAPDGSSSTFLDLSDRISTGGERGLLGLAFSPDHATDGRFWVNYTDGSGDTVVARYEVSSNPDRADPDSHTVVLEVDQPYSNHNGGMLAFAQDGMLLVGMGDGGSGGDPLGTGQDNADLLGAVLRLDVVRRDGTGYRVPPDNPFVGDGSERRPEVWAYGLRNPWRFSVDRLTGDVWIGDVGQGAVEEVDRLPYRPSTAFNLGWDRFEGSSCFDGPCGDRTGLTFPVTEYDHGLGQSITGGYVSRAASTPSLYGVYLYADYVQGWIRAYDPSTRRDVELDVPNVGNVLGFGQDADGELYVLTTSGVFALRGEGSGTAFSDVPVAGLFAPSITILAQAGVTGGCEPLVPHRYCPTTIVTRGQMAGFLAAALDLPDAPESFTDVADDGPFAGAIGALVAAVITDGCAPDRFCPSQPITRGQLAAFLAAALDLPDAPADFLDVPADNRFAGAIGAVDVAGITSGCAPELFCPQGRVTRATMAELLVAAFEL
jgi:hypothetical protein